jgi:hypothetical protein
MTDTLRLHRIPFYHLTKRASGHDLYDTPISLHLRQAQHVYTTIRDIFIRRSCC